MKLTINGVEREISGGKSLLSLLQEINASEPYAVAVNQAFVPRAKCEEHQLNEGDKIEVLSPIQGG